MLQTKEQHEIQELARFRAKIDRVEREPIDHEDLSLWRLYLERPQTKQYEERSFGDVIEERLSWLVAGHYGYGSYLATQDVLSRKRMNRRAWLIQTIGALEWNVKPSATRRIWNKLTQDQQDRVNAIVDRVITEWESEQK